jgi:hypothetical protein
MVSSVPIAPESYTLDSALLARPGNDEIQLDSRLRPEVHFYDTGHFALETHVREIGTEIHRFLDQHLKSETAE